MNWFVMIAAMLLSAPVHGQVTAADEAAEAVLRQADANGDGGLSRDEFRDFMQGMAGLGHRSARLVSTFGVYGIAFRRIDTDGDGWASPAELAAARD